MYASHLDAAIFGWYSKKLGDLLADYYLSNGLDENVIAYRALGKGNYDFSAEVLAFSKVKHRCVILAFDVTGFFDNLSHSRLKDRLKALLNTDELPRDWFNVFRAVTKFRFVKTEDLKANPTLKARLDERTRSRVATVAELKNFAIPFCENGSQLSPVRRPNSAGIPQGTPISASLSNAYMLEFDKGMKAHCDSIGAMYRRYSDDILIVCGDEEAAEVEKIVRALLLIEGLKISDKKTEITHFDPSAQSLPMAKRAAQYLGFSFYPDGAAIRPSSISKQARKIRRSVTRAKRAAQKGTGVLHTRKLRKRFSLIVDGSTGRILRNFPSYGYRSADAFDDGAKIRSQVQRLERLLAREIAKARTEL
jgi:hypothetical protein